MPLLFTRTARLRLRDAWNAVKPDKCEVDFDKFRDNETLIHFSDEEMVESMIEAGIDVGKALITISEWEGKLSAFSSVERPRESPIEGALEASATGTHAEEKVVILEDDADIQVEKVPEEAVDDGWPKDRPLEWPGPNES